MLAAAKERAIDMTLCISEILSEKRPIDLPASTSRKVALGSGTRLYGRDSNIDPWERA